MDEKFKVARKYLQLRGMEMLEEIQDKSVIVCNDGDDLVFVFVCDEIVDENNAPFDHLAFIDMASNYLSEHVLDYDQAIRADRFAMKVLPGRRAFIQYFVGWSK